MDSSVINRREFLKTSALTGAALAASGSLFTALGKDTLTTPITPKVYVCEVCGHLEFGNAPESCPVCHAPKDRFAQNNNIFAEAQAKSKDLAVGHIPVIHAHKHSELITEEPCQDAFVRIGEKLHPMTEAHHIRFIDCYINDVYIARTFLTFGSFPAAGFYAKALGTRVRIVELCNLHGYWQAEAII